MDRQIAYSHRMKDGKYDDDYTLFESGRVLHEFDKSSYPGGYDLKEDLIGSQLKHEVKLRLFNAAAEGEKELARSLLAMHE